MSYFSLNYPNLRFLKASSENSSGFRNNQLGAIHAIASHFTLETNPAVVTMPTGSGKTAVLVASSYLLEPTRVLVITPSVLVRDQIAEEFETLKTLKRIHAMDENVESPSVLTVKTRVTKTEAWNDMRDYGVVVATPSTVSPGYLDIPLPPEDLFNLILVDEAHHEPARTWNELLDSLPYARRVLFTATPYRSDRREIRGSYVYTYPTRKAYEDNIFGSVGFQPVTPQEDETEDIAIARAAELTFNRDKQDGYSHYLLARSRSKDHAKELQEVYKSQTSLRMAVVNSRNSYKYNKAVLDRLEQNELDGIITVDMLSEGIDIPRLKISAVHAPHQSLAVTLQFIGRFARTNDPRVGRATFLAVPNQNLSEEVRRLYEEDAIWQDIVPALNDQRIKQEIDVRGFLEEFEREKNLALETLDFSLYALRPYHHIKVYEIPENSSVNIAQDVKLKSPFQVIHHQISVQGKTTVFVARQNSKPRWTRSDSFSQYDYHLFIIYFDEETRLLFLNASYTKSEPLYTELIKLFVNGKASKVPFHLVNKALLGLKDFKIYNVGQPKTQNSGSESFRQIMGPRADQAINKADSRTYHRGHSFGSAKENNEDVTIGVSPSAKIWSNKTDQLPNFISWCKKLAKKIRSNQEPTTNTNLDFLKLAESVTSIDNFSKVIFANWHEHTYSGVVRLIYKSSGKEVQTQLLQTFISVNRPACTSEHIEFTLESGEIELRLRFIVGQEYDFEILDSNTEEPEIIDADGRSFLLTDYLRGYPLTFHFADHSSLVGNERFSSPSDGDLAFDPESIEVVDWKAKNVDVTKEIDKAEEGKISVHDFLKIQLNNKNPELIFYDHGTGEMADFFTVHRNTGSLEIAFYHVKGSGGQNPNERVNDLYEVCMQGVRSIRFTKNPDRILEHIEDRHTRLDKPFIEGDLTKLKALMDEAKSNLTTYEIVLVQPGIPKNAITDNTDNVLGATSAYVRQHCEPLRILASEAEKPSVK